jgi:hypothetical protein
MVSEDPVSHLINLIQQAPQLGGLRTDGDSIRELLVGVSCPDFRGVR